MPGRNSRRVFHLVVNLVILFSLLLPQSVDAAPSFLQTESLPLCGIGIDSRMPAFYSDETSGIDDVITGFAAGVQFNTQDIWVSLDEGIGSGNILPYNLWGTELGRMLLLVDMRLKEAYAQTIREVGQLRPLFGLPKGQLKFAGRITLIPDRVDYFLTEKGVFVDDVDFKVDVRLSLLNKPLLTYIIQGVESRIKESYEYKRFKRMYAGFALARYLRHNLGKKASYFLGIIGRSMPLSSPIGWHPADFYDLYTASLRKAIGNSSKTVSGGISPKAPRLVEVGARNMYGVSRRSVVAGILFAGLMGLMPGRLWAAGMVRRPIPKPPVKPSEEAEETPVEKTSGISSIIPESHINTFNKINELLGSLKTMSPASSLAQKRQEIEARILELADETIRAIEAEGRHSDAERFKKYIASRSAFLGLALFMGDIERIKQAFKASPWGKFLGLSDKELDKIVEESFNDTVRICMRSETLRWFVIHSPPGKKKPNKEKLAEEVLSSYSQKHYGVDFKDSSMYLVSPYVIFPAVFMYNAMKKKGFFSNADGSVKIDLDMFLAIALREGLSKFGEDQFNGEETRVWNRRPLGLDRFGSVTEREELFSMGLIPEGFKRDYLRGRDIDRDKKTVWDPKKEKWVEVDAYPDIDFAMDIPYFGNEYAAVGVLGALIQQDIVRLTNNKDRMKTLQKYAKDGNNVWPLVFLYFQFNGTTLTSKNIFGMLRRRKYPLNEVQDAKRMKKHARKRAAIIRETAGRKARDLFLSRFDNMAGLLMWLDYLKHFMEGAPKTALTQNRQLPNFKKIQKRVQNYAQDLFRQSPSTARESQVSYSQLIAGIAGMTALGIEGTDEDLRNLHSSNLAKAADPKDFLDAKRLNEVGEALNSLFPVDELERWPDNLRALIEKLSETGSPKNKATAVDVHTWLLKIIQTRQTGFLSNLPDFIVDDPEKAQESIKEITELSRYLQMFLAFKPNWKEDFRDKGERYTTINEWRMYLDLPGMQGGQLYIPGKEDPDTFNALREQIKSDVDKSLDSIFAQEVRELTDEQVRSIKQFLQRLSMVDIAPRGIGVYQGNIIGLIDMGEGRERLVVFRAKDDAEKVDVNDRYGALLLPDFESERLSIYDGEISSLGDISLVPEHKRLVLSDGAAIIIEPSKGPLAEKKNAPAGGIYF